MKYKLIIIFLIVLFSRCTVGSYVYFLSEEPFIIEITAIDTFKNEKTAMYSYTITSMPDNVFRSSDFFIDTIGIYDVGYKFKVITEEE